MPKYKINANFEREVPVSEKDPNLGLKKAIVKSSEIIEADHMLQALERSTCILGTETIVSLMRDTKKEELEQK